MDMNSPFQDSVTGLCGNYDKKELHLLRYNALQSVQSQPMFRRNMSLPSSGSKNKSSKKPGTTRHAVHLKSTAVDVPAL
jgi:hypothetical protein